MLQSSWSAAHLYSLQPHEQMRKVHFTLYGWAVLQYGEVTFHTSTVQMVVLLQFNRASVSCLCRWRPFTQPNCVLGDPLPNTFSVHQSLTLKSLHSTTKLSYAILSEALVSLTAEGQSILLPVPNPVLAQEKKSKSSKHPQESVAAWGRSEDGELVSIRRYLPDAAFTLNDEFIKKLGVSRSVSRPSVQRTASVQRTSQLHQADILCRK